MVLRSFILFVKLIKITSLGHKLPILWRVDCRNCYRRMQLTLTDRLVSNEIGWFKTTQSNGRFHGSDCFSQHVDLKYRFWFQKVKV